MNVLSLLQERFRSALTGWVSDVEAAVALIKPTSDSRHGDYQANCAMSLGKQLGRKPREVAEEIVKRLDLGNLLQPPEIAGPGFINLRLQDDWLAVQVRAMAADDRLGVAPLTQPKTIVIDYSSPNVAKPMHIGHIRSTIIGDSLARLLRFLGHQVVADNHLGDWGLQMGQIIWGWKNHRDEKAYKTDPVGELSRLYRLSARLIKPIEKYGKKLEKVQKLLDQGKQAEAEKLFQTLCLDDGDEQENIPSLEEAQRLVAQGRPVEEAARLETVKLHQGDPENRALWEQFMPHCREALQGVYERLDIHFDIQLGESAYDEMLQAVVADLKAKGIAVESQGAVVVEVAGSPVPFLVQKRDGAYNYGTTDLATIQYRVKHFKPNSLLYVVDHRQANHFKPLFEVARRWGYDNVVMEHVGFGTIMGEDGKPFRTRDGDVVGLESLLDQAVAEARKVVDQESPETPVEQRAQIAQVVGLGAVKYADLSHNRLSDYVFSYSKMLAMNGNTGTYMQYAYARNRSIFGKGNEDPARFRSNPPPVQLSTAPERALALWLLRFEEALQNAAADYQPSAITSYLWDLAKTYSTFFVQCPVLRAETPELRDSRLLLCDLTARVIQKGLELLGIRTVERM